MYLLFYQNNYRGPPVPDDVTALTQPPQPLPPENDVPEVYFFQLLYNVVLLTYCSEKRPPFPGCLFKVISVGISFFIGYIILSSSK